MIFYETAGQPRGLLLLLYAGACAGALYDVLRGLGRHGPGWLSGTADFIWCLLSAGLCFLALAMAGENRMRLYALAGLAGGALLYALGIRRVLRGLGRRAKACMAGFSKQEKKGEAANAKTKEKEA